MQPLAALSAGECFPPAASAAAPQGMAGSNWTGIRSRLAAIFGPSVSSGTRQSLEQEEIGQEQA